MKYIKKFEAELHEVQKGEYVLLDFETSNYEGGFYDFIENNVGQFIDNDYYSAVIKYENVPEDLIDKFDAENCIVADIDFIYKHSFDKEELESFLATKKYNL